MPYIKTERRDHIDAGICPINTGEINYAVSMICKRYLDTFGLSYTVINDIMGALEGAKLEFYKRVAEPYEAQKRYENGDIYE
jgi:hypothetical protein